MIPMAAISCENRNRCAASVPSSSYIIRNRMTTGVKMRPKFRRFSVFYSMKRVDRSGSRKNCPARKKRLRNM